MVRKQVTLALMLGMGCGDSVAQGEGSSTGTAATGTGDAEASSGEPTTVTPTTGAVETTGTGTTTSEATGTGESSSGTGEPARCYENSIYSAVAELTAERLAGFDCITGSVTIVAGTGTDLWFLSEIRSIGGSLDILGMHEIVSLKGLEKLESIGGRLLLEDTPQLIDASALAGLQALGGHLELRAAGALPALTLPLLTKLNGHLQITAASLTSLDLTGVTSIAGEIEIERTRLPTLAGLAGLTTITKGLDLADNDLLIDLTGLAALGHFEGALAVHDHQSLVSLAGLQGVSKLLSVYVLANPALTSVAALDGATTSWATFANSPKLAALPKLQGELKTLVVDRCTVLPSLAGLEATVVTNELVLADNHGLVDLQGLGGIAAEIEHLELRDNHGLKTLAGPSGPSHVDQLVIKGSPLLGSLGLLTDLGGVGNLAIADTGVVSLLPLAKLTSALSVVIDGNVQLKSLAGLEDLVTIGELHIRQNPKLTGLAPLQAGALVEVTEEFAISDNPLLPSCAAKQLYDKLTKQPPGDKFCFDNKVDACSGLGGCIVEPMP